MTLRPRSRGLDRATLARQVRELSAQALLGARADDAALLRTEIPAEFVEYLKSCGLVVPRLLVHPEIDANSSLRPFGWTAEAVELNRRCRRPVEHPSLSAIERVNARSFSLKLEEELDPAGPLGVLIDSPEELDAFLARATPGSEWVLKAEHGNSGLGNRRLRQPRLASADRRFVEGLFTEDDRLVVEPWLARLRDWCMVFAVPFEPASARVHETICTRDGALIGALFEPGGPTDMLWSDELMQTATQVATKLEVEGYFGPVCVDAFSWRDGDEIKLRPLADLNCRRSMSDGAYRMWSRAVPDHTLYYRFFNRRKLRLAAEIHEAAAALGEDRFDPARQRGVLFASPLDYTKIAVVFVGHDRADVFALERSFRERFEA